MTTGLVIPLRGISEAAAKLKMAAPRALAFCVPFVEEAIFTNRKQTNGAYFASLSRMDGSCISRCGSF